MKKFRPHRRSAVVLGAAALATAMTGFVASPGTAAPSAGPVAKTAAAPGKAELVMDGRRLPRPVNYVLVRIVPPNDIRLDEKKRPFVVVDPRAPLSSTGTFRNRRVIYSLAFAGLPYFWRA